MNIAGTAGRYKTVSLGENLVGQFFCTLYYKNVIFFRKYVYFFKN